MVTKLHIEIIHCVKQSIFKLWFVHPVTKHIN